MTLREIVGPILSLCCILCVPPAAAGQPAARVGDMTTDPTVQPGPVPCVGGPILPPGVPTVLIEGLPAATLGGGVVTACGPTTIATGSATVLIGNLPAARMGDLTSRGGTIVNGAPTVLIGG